MAGDAAAALGVAVPAALGDLGEPGDGVPRLPLRRRKAVVVLAHGLSMHPPASAGPARSDLVARFFRLDLARFIAGSAATAGGALLDIALHRPVKSGGVMRATKFSEDVVPLTKLKVNYTHLRAHETDSYLVCRL